MDVLLPQGVGEPHAPFPARPPSTPGVVPLTTGRRESQRGSGSSFVKVATGLSWGRGDPPPFMHHEYELLIEAKGDSITVLGYWWTKTFRLTGRDAEAEPLERRALEMRALHAERNRREGS
jgi:hypothetical protein